MANVMRYNKNVKEEDRELLEKKMSIGWVCAHFCCYDCAKEKLDASDKYHRVKRNKNWKKKTLRTHRNSK